MYYTEKIQLNDALLLLKACGLTAPEGADYTAGVFGDDGRLVATGSLKGDMIQGMAVDPACQGEDLTAKVLTHLIQQAQDAQTLYLFTKPEKAMQFTGLGFRLVAKARPYAALLEWGQQGVKQYQEQLKFVRTEVEGRGGAKVCDTLNGVAEPNDYGKSVIGALVMNCNPFTKGHRYLIQQAASQCDHVYVLVVEEDLSRFPFRDRLTLVEAGTQDLPNVTVIPGGRYAVSTLTFPSYFTKEEKVADAHAAIDAELFATIIAPTLGVTKRFVGTEPMSKVTNIYNETLKKRLPKHGIEVIEIPRLEEGDYPISASRVRDLIDQGGKKAWAELQTLVPDHTYNYLDQNHHKVTLMELLDSREDRVIRQRELLEKHGGILISVTLNIPGPVKDKPKYRKALDMAMDSLEEKAGTTVILHQECRYKLTGPEGYLCVGDETFDGETWKRMTIDIEENHELGRIFDIDVLTTAGGISRSQLDLPGRKCLICGQPAKVCARSQKHPMEELLAKIDEILIGLE